MSNQSKFDVLAHLARTIDSFMTQEAAIVSVNPELLDRIRGGYEYANTSCNNDGCSNSNSSCSNFGCSPTNNNSNCSNTACH